MVTVAPIKDAKKPNSTAMGCVFNTNEASTLILAPTMNRCDMPLIHSRNSFTIMVIPSINTNKPAVNIKASTTSTTPNDLSPVGDSPIHFSVAEESLI